MTTTPDLGDDTLITRKQLAELRGTTERQLEREASKGEGVPYVRLGERQVRYRIGDYRAFLRARTFPHHAAELAQQAADPARAT